MTKKILPVFLLLSLAATSNKLIAQNNNEPPRSMSVTVKDSEAMSKKDTSVGKLSVTRHSVTVNGKVINYTATTGYMPMKDKDDKLIAKLFFVAYTGDNTGNKGKRPVTFVFNGGPGSASIWLHMGSFSPVRVKFAD